MKKMIVRRPGVYVSEGRLDGMVEEAVARLDPLVARDEEFLRRFGRWTRPSHAPKYPIETWANAWIRWDPRGDGIVDIEPFVRCFPDRADQVLIGEIARFVVEEVIGKFATDETLRVFRLSLLRRLDDVGF